jgi:hypothetical protein
MRIVDVFARFEGEDYSFAPSTNRFEEWLFRYLWAVPLVPLCISIASALLALNLPHKIIRIGDFVRTSTWAVDNLVRSTAVVILPVLGILVIEALMIKRFAKTAPKLFLSLAKAGRLRPPPNSPSPGDHASPAADSPKKEVEDKLWDRFKDSLYIKPGNWQTYVEDFQRALHSPWRHILSAVFIIIAYLFAITAGIQGDSYLLFTGGIEGGTVQEMAPFLIWAVVLIIISPPFLGIFIANGVWILIVVGVYIQWLPQVFALDIQPRHGDMCGGLKRVGSLCLQMAVIVTLPATIFGFWVLAPVLNQLIPVITDIMYFAIGLMVVIGCFDFFLPMWRIHREMVSAKVRFQDEAIFRIAPIETRFRELSAQGKWDDEETKEIENRFFKLEQLYPTHLKFPTWPFDTNIMLKFLTPQVVPLITLVVGFREGNAPLLESVLEFIENLLW